VSLAVAEHPGEALTYFRSRYGVMP